MTAVRLGQTVGVEVGFFEKVALRLDWNNENEQSCEELGLLTSHFLVQLPPHLQMPPCLQNSARCWSLGNL